MNTLFEKILDLATPHLKKGVMKDFVLHTKGVVKAMEAILDKEGGDKKILIPAAILHDVGWSRVDLALQKSEKADDKLKALHLHIENAPPIIEEVLSKVGYTKEDIKRVVDIVVAHKFQDPSEKEKKMLIDADAVSDAFKDQFYSDVAYYNKKPKLGQD